jgi:hypothetical protein
MEKEKKNKPFYKKWWFWVIAVIVLFAIGSPGEGEETSDSDDEDVNDIEVQAETDDTEESSEDHEEISTVVDLTLNTELNDDVLDFQGETNLPDGTLIAYEVWHEEDFDQFAEGNIEVEDGNYKEEVSVSDWPDGEIIVWVSFQTVLGTSVQQPDEIIEVFGEMGENIEGDNVSESDVMNSVELEETLMKNTGESSAADQEESEETLSQQNAVAMAGDYLAYTAFSESGLIEQLEFEGFSNEDATYAVNQIDVDWQEQAVNMAQEYLDYTSFSRSGLIEQLEYEGFSNEHATYAVDEIGL